MGPCIVSVFQCISNKMQRYTVYLYLETALHVSDGTSTHHQERIQHTKATVVTDQSWKIQPTQRHTVTGGCMCRIRRLLMMDARVPETCRAE
jgi:hypothetical protein